MAKRGQITLFIIIGIVVAVLIGFLVFMRDSGSDDITASIDLGEDESSGVQQFVETCIGKTAERSADYIGYQGGYCDAPDGSYDAGQMLAVPYYVDHEIGDIAPDADTVKLQMENCVELMIWSCLDNFDAFKEQGMTIKLPTDAKANVLFVGSDIQVKLNMPLKIIEGDKEISITDFSKKVPHPLSAMHSISLKAADLIYSDLEIIPLADLSVLFFDSDMSFTSQKEGRKVLFIVDKVMDDSTTKSFNFAVNYGDA